MRKKKKKALKNSRAKKVYNIEWHVKLYVRSPKNDETFKKSYFGSQYKHVEEELHYLESI